MCMWIYVLFFSFILFLYICINWIKIHDFTLIRIVGRVKCNIVYAYENLLKNRNM
jgi:hypothetical protein